MSKRVTLNSARTEPFYRPPVPSGYISRARLYQRFNTGLQGRLILVCAPAGCGKSALTSAFCEQLPAPWHSVWLSLSARDKEPGRFFERFLNAVHRVYPDAGEHALAQ